MPARLQEYHRPPDPTRAAVLLQRPGVRTVPIAGGQRIPVEPYTDTGAAVDLSGLRLDLLTINGDILHLGGSATPHTAADAPHLQSPAGGIPPKAAQLAAHPSHGHGGRCAFEPHRPPRKTTPLIHYLQKENDLVLEITFKQLHTGRGGALARVARTRSPRPWVRAFEICPSPPSRCGGPDRGRHAIGH